MTKATVRYERRKQQGSAECAVRGKRTPAEKNMYACAGSREKPALPPLITLSIRWTSCPYSEVRVSALGGGWREGEIPCDLRLHSRNITVLLVQRFNLHLTSLFK